MEFQAEWILCCIYFREQVNFDFFFFNIVHIQQSLIPAFAG